MCFLCIYKFKESVWCVYFKSTVWPSLDNWLVWWLYWPWVSTWDVLWVWGMCCTVYSVHRAEGDSWGSRLQWPPGPAPDTSVPSPRRLTSDGHGQCQPRGGGCQHSHLLTGHHHVSSLWGRGAWADTDTTPHARPLLWCLSSDKMCVKSSVVNFELVSDAWTNSGGSNWGIVGLRLDVVCSITPKVVMLVCRVGIIKIA